MSKVSTHESSEYFLATTALEDFWDTSKPILFLGEWCKRYSRRSFWEPLGGITIENSWKDSQECLATYVNVHAIYERLLKSLAGSLNEIHRLNYSERFWRVIIGPWLYFYVSVAYDRYTNLKKALALYPDITTIGITEDSYITPNDMFDFVQCVIDDPYNLQLYTKILNGLGLSFPRRDLKIESNSVVENESKPLWKASIVRFFKSLIRHIQNNGSIFLKNSYFSRDVELQLLWKTKGRVWPIIEKTTAIPAFQLNKQMRSLLQGSLPEENQFERILKDMLPMDIPYSYVEAFFAINKNAKQNYPSKPKILFSANAWYFDEAFKQWSALSAESGAMLLGTQHGGKYGSVANSSSETHELIITDQYYSWGWERPESTCKVIPLPATKLTGRRQIGASNEKDGIVFVTTSMPRYLRYITIIDSRFNEYLAWQIRFIDSITPSLKPSIRIRLYSEDYGWDMEERLVDRNPDIAFERGDVAFLDSLENARLYVCDHLSTTFAEALSANKPTILFWDPADNLLRPEAEPYYNELRLAGILYDTPEDAAAAVGEAYYDIERWWNDPDRQAIRLKFCDRFARTSPNAIDEWAAEFNQLASEATLKELIGGLN